MGARQSGQSDAGQLKEMLEGEEPEPSRADCADPNPWSVFHSHALSSW